MGNPAGHRWEPIRIEVGDGLRTPLLGEIAAGRPVEAAAVSAAIELPAGLWNGRKVFALRVRGTSMIDEGIRDGDYLIVEPRDTADDGQTVVVEVDGEVTVKRLFRDGRAGVRLQPANPEMLALEVPAARVRIVGAVVGVFRRRGFRPSRPRPGRAPAHDGRTLDLTLRVIDQSMRDAEALAAARTGSRAGRLREIARALRSLRDCYLSTRVPRLREALLREAGEMVRRVRRFGAEPS